MVDGVKKFSELETGVYDKEHPAYIPFIQEQGTDENNEALPILNRKISLNHLPIIETKISNRVLGINETATDFELKEVPLKITGANGINVNNKDPKFPVIELGEAKQGGGHTVGEIFYSFRNQDILNGAYPADGREFLQTDFVQSNYDPYTLLLEGKLPSYDLNEKVYVPLSQYSSNTSQPITLTDYTYSNFVNNNFVALPNLLVDNDTLTTSYKAKPFEIKFKVKFKDNAYIFNTSSSNYSILFGLIGNKAVIYISSNGSSWGIVHNKSGINNFLLNTDYYFKLGWDGNRYYVDYSEDGEQYFNDIEVVSSIPFYVDSQPQFGNVWKDNKNDFELDYRFITLVSDGKIIYKGEFENAYERDMVLNGSCNIFGLDYVNGKFKIPTINTRFLISNYKDKDRNLSYNIYSDGWIELYNIISRTLQNEVYSLPFEMKDTNYYITAMQDDNGLSNIAGITNFGKIDTQHFKIWTSDDHTFNQVRVIYKVEGYLADKYIPIKYKTFIQLSTDTTEVSIEDYTSQLDNYFDTQIKTDINNYLNDVSKKELDDYEKEQESEINNYVQDISKVDIANYVNDTSKPTIDSYVDNTSKVEINNFIENDSKPQIDNYVLNTSFPQLKDETDKQLGRVINQGDIEVERVNLAGTANALIGFPMFWIGDVEDIPEKFIAMVGQKVVPEDYINLFTTWKCKYGGYVGILYPYKDTDENIVYCADIPDPDGKESIGKNRVYNSDIDVLGYITAYDSETKTITVSQDGVEKTYTKDQEGASIESNVFVIPQINDGRFLEGNLPLAGSMVEAGLPEIAGQLIRVAGGINSFTEASGAFSQSNNSVWSWWNKETSCGISNIYLSANRYNSIYSADIKTNQPKAIRGVWITKYI